MCFNADEHHFEQLFKIQVNRVKSYHDINIEGVDKPVRSVERFLLKQWLRTGKFMLQVLLRSLGSDLTIVVVRNMQNP
jgi:hypothetical protein